MTHYLGGEPPGCNTWHNTTSFTTDPMEEAEKHVIVRMDCRHFRGDRPCVPHKQTGVHCDDCGEYDTVSEKILIIKLAADGDVLRTTSLLPALKEVYENSHITWMTEFSARPLLLNNPLVDRIWSPPERFLPALMIEVFDLVINMDADSRSCSLAGVVKGTAKKGFVLDKNGEIDPLSDAAREWFQLGIWDDLKRENRQSYPETIYEIAGLNGPPHPPKIYLMNDEITDSRKYLLECGWHPEHDRQVVGINTGAGRRWRRKALPVETVVNVLDAIVNSSPPVDVFLLGGPEERERNSYMVAKFRDRVIDTGNDNSLRRFAAIVSHTHVLLTADTLAMHIGMALGKYVVAHFGPTSSWEIDMWGNGERIVPDMDCTCCYLPDCDRSPACNESLSPTEIVRAIQKGLTRSSRNPR